MFTPMTGPPRCRDRPSRAAAAAAPALLNPIRLTSARSAVSRNIRGGGFPGWARAVTVPTSTNPNPNAASPRVPRASLSKPGRQPERPGKLQPQRPHPQHRVTGRQPPPEQPRRPRHPRHPPDQPEGRQVRRLRGHPP